MEPESFRWFGVPHMRVLDMWIVTLKRYSFVSMLSMGTMVCSKTFPVDCAKAFSLCFVNMDYSKSFGGTQISNSEIRYVYYKLISTMHVENDEHM